MEVIVEQPRLHQVCLKHGDTAVSSEILKKAAIWTYQSGL